MKDNPSFEEEIVLNMRTRNMAAIMIQSIQKQVGYYAILRQQRTKLKVV